MIARLLFFSFALLLSLAGAFYAVLLVSTLGTSLSGVITLAVWFFATYTLLQMSHAWIVDIRLGAKYSRHAFLAGIGALLVIPILGLFDSSTWSLETPMKLAGFILVEAIFVSPAIALAAYLNRFHAASGQASSA